MKRNIVFDLDGTICFNGVQIDEGLVESVVRLATEENVIFASARPIRDMLPVLKEHKLLATCDLIGGNGSIVKQNGVIVSESIDRSVVDNVLKLAAQSNHKVLIDSKWDYHYNGDVSRELYKRIDTDKQARNTSYENFEDIIKIVVMYNDEEAEAALSIYKPYIEECHSNCYEDEKMFDILPSGVNKFTALNKHFGLSKGDYIAFGNDTNDIELLQNAKSGFIVGDSLKLAGCENLPIEKLIQLLTVV